MGRLFLSDLGDNKLKNNKSRAVGLVLLLPAVIFVLSCLCLAQQGADISEGDTSRISETSAGSDTAEGGNVTQLNLSVIISTSKWQGYYGNVTGALALGSGSDYFYNFSNSVVDAVYASQNESFDFTAIEQAAAADVDTQWGYTTATDSDQAADIFTGTTSVGGVSAPSAELEPVGNGWNSTIFDCGSNDDKSYFAFGVNVQDAGNGCFDGTTCQYELIVPADGASSELYYFFLSIE